MYATVEVRLYLIILECMNKHKEMLEVLKGPLAGQLLDLVTCAVLTSCGAAKAVGTFM